MKTEYQILQEITRLENLDISPDVDYLTRINSLQWVLDSEESAMCEANSNAVLDEVAPILTKELLSKIVRYCSRYVVGAIEWDGDFTVHDEDMLIDNIAGDIKRGAI